MPFDYRKREPIQPKVVTQLVEKEVEIEVSIPLTLDEVAAGLNMLSRISDRDLALDAIQYGEGKTFKECFDGLCEHVYDEALLMLDECEIPTALKEELDSEDKDIASNARLDVFDIMLNTDSIIGFRTVETWNAFNPHHAITIDDLDLDSVRGKPIGIYKTKSLCKSGNFDGRKQKCEKVKTTHFGGVTTAYVRRTIEGKYIGTKAQQRAREKQGRKMGKKHKSSTSIKKATKARQAED